MKRTILAGLLVLGAMSFAHAKGLPSPFTPFTPPTKAVAGTLTSGVAVTGDPLKDILTTALNKRDQIVGDLNQALTTQAAVINPATGSAWDPYSVMCLSGIPAVGTQGQPGFVAATPGLIAWFQGLTAPAVGGVPALPDSPSAATLAVHARLILMAANSDVGAVLNQINTTGIPSNLKLACGAVINDTVTQGQNIVNQGAAFAALLAKFVPIK